MGIITSKFKKKTQTTKTVSTKKKKPAGTEQAKSVESGSETFNDEQSLKVVKEQTAGAYYNLFMRRTKELGTLNRTFATFDFRKGLKNVKTKNIQNLEYGVYSLLAVLNAFVCEGKELRYQAKNVEKPLPLLMSAYLSASAYTFVELFMSIVPNKANIKLRAKLEKEVLKSGKTKKKKLLTTRASKTKARIKNKKSVSKASSEASDISRKESGISVSELGEGMRDKNLSNMHLEIAEAFRLYGFEKYVSKRLGDRVTGATLLSNKIALASASMFNTSLTAYFSEKDIKIFRLKERIITKNGASKRFINQLKKEEQIERSLPDFFIEIFETIRVAFELDGQKELNLEALQFSVATNDSDGEQQIQNMFDAVLGENQRSKKAFSKKFCNFLMPQFEMCKELEEFFEFGTFDALLNLEMSEEAKRLLGKLTCADNMHGAKSESERFTVFMMNYLKENAQILDDPM